MKKGKMIGIAVIAAVLGVGIYYYLALPALNIHSVGLWMFMMGLYVFVFAGIFLWRRIPLDEVRSHKGVRMAFRGLLLLVLVYAVGSVLSSPIINANKYRELLTVTEGVFSTDIAELPHDRIPLLDRESAVIMGNRKMGSMVDMVSQYEVDELYSQINYQNKPVRVSPLKYANTIKWFTNRKEGLMAYIKIDMTTQTTELVKLSQGMKYSTCEHFNRNIYRHLRFRYPTYIFNELSFEIDDEGIPYWIAPVKKFNVGLFGGETVGRVVLCNAITGEMQDFPIEDVPTWIDRAYSSDRLVELYNYYGTLKHGYFNSVLGQRDCLRTTDGYNYLAIDDDVWMYTGITSVSGDQSNVGFVLMNQRTMETKFYPVEGATETSAMASAEGQVQHLNYRATFPLLLNVAGEPTYFVALKDNGGLIKLYAMVNVSKYQIVATGDSLSECEQEYAKLMLENGIGTDAAAASDIKSIRGVITKMVPGVVDGNSHYYLMIQGSDAIFDVVVSDFIGIIRYEEGDTVSLEYSESEPMYFVVGLK